ncbi:MAG TPA: sulfatase [Planctomycetota bacterium]|nr:sulfatase [Planctomycetota bacterium]
MRRRRVAPLVGVAFGLAVLGGGAWWTLRRAPAPADVVLISIDTCRADRVGPGGARLADGSSPTPTLDRLAADGAWFPDALTPAPLTLPAHVTMMSGLYPDRHGVRENDSFRVPPRARRSYALLAEELRDAGFLAAAFVSAQPLDRRFGLDQGFDVYDEVGRSAARGAGLFFRERDADATVERAAQWLHAHDAAPRRFLFAHFFDPHFPYERRADSPATLPDGTAGDYLAEIVAVDRAIARLLAALPRGGDDAWIVVTGDHGEGLGDHGEATHGYFLHDTVLRVPLIVRPPKGKNAPRPHVRPARLVDLRATILDAVGVAAPPRDGESLLRPPTRPFRDRAETLYAYYQHQYARLRAHRDETWKLTEGGGREAVTRWREPGGEAAAPAAEAEVEAARLRALLFEALAAAGAEVADAAAASTEIGGVYHGARSPSGDVEPAEDRNRTLPHPADRVETLRDLDAARSALRRGEAARAALLLKAHAAERDENPALLLWTGRAVREAAGDPRLPSPVRLKELDDAAAMFRTLSERWRDPRGADLELLCLRDRYALAAERGVADETVRKASAEIAARGGTAVTFALRGLAKADLGDLAGAAADLAVARERDPDDRKIALDYARILALRDAGRSGR